MFFYFLFSKKLSARVLPMISTCSTHRRSGVFYHMYVENEMNVDEKDKQISANQHVQIYNKMKNKNRLNIDGCSS